MFEGIKETLRKKREEKLLTNLRNTLSNIREFSLKHPEIDTAYTQEGFSEAITALEKIKIILDQRLPFDE